jgi:hypothetical protein
MALVLVQNSIPFTRVFCKGLAVNGFANLRIIFPDPGAAALAKRDWAGADGHNVRIPPHITECVFVTYIQISSARFIFLVCK